MLIDHLRITSTNEPHELQVTVAKRRTSGASKGFWTRVVLERGWAVAFNDDPYDLSSIHEQFSSSSITAGPSSYRKLMASVLARTEEMIRMYLIGLFGDRPCIVKIKVNLWRR